MHSQAWWLTRAPPRARAGLPAGQEPKGKWFCPGCAAQRKRTKAAAGGGGGGGVGGGGGGVGGGAALAQP